MFLLFVRYLLACVFTLQEKFFLLLRFLRHLMGLPCLFPFKSFLLLNLLACVFTLQQKFLLLLRFLRHLRTSRGPSMPFYLSSLFFCEICYSCYSCDICLFSRCKKNSCYFCDICGHHMGLPCLFTFQAFSFVKCVTLVILAIFAGVRFNVARKILVTFAIFETFADISWAFVAFLPFKSFLLRNLLLLLFLRYLLARVFTSQRRPMRCPQKSQK